MFRYPDDGEDGDMELTAFTIEIQPATPGGVIGIEDLLVGACIKPLGMLILLILISLVTTFATGDGSPSRLFLMDCSTTTLWTSLFPIAGCLVSFCYYNALCFIAISVFEDSIFLKNRHFFIQERFDKLLYSINMIIKCGI